MLEQALDWICMFLRRRANEVMVVTRDSARLEQIVDSIGADELRIARAPSGSAALDLLNRPPFACVVLDSASPDMSIAECVERASTGGNALAPPVVLYSDEPPSDHNGQGFPQHPQAAPFRRIWSRERLLDQTAFFLHTPLIKLSEPKRRTIERLYQDDVVLSGKRVLIVDDDIRNIFSLTSVLEWRNMVVVSSETVRDAIRILQAEPGIDLVLMDIMMPEMDGLDTMRVIRKLSQFNSLPIIAVTAKAMKGDREKCIEASAWDYLSKPVDTEQLLAVLRVWLHRLNRHSVFCEPV
jgi:CheY-like chemotaxis protein